jgi:hypothetical protein
MHLLLPSAFNFLPIIVAEKSVLLRFRKSRFWSAARTQVCRDFQQVIQTNAGRVLYTGQSLLSCVIPYHDTENDSRVDSICSSDSGFPELRFWLGEQLSPLKPFVVFSGPLKCMQYLNFGHARFLPQNLVSVFTNRGIIPRYVGWNGC